MKCIYLRKLKVRKWMCDATKTLNTATFKLTKECACWDDYEGCPYYTKSKKLYIFEE